VLAGATPLPGLRVCNPVLKLGQMSYSSTLSSERACEKQVVVQFREGAIYKAHHRSSTESVKLLIQGRTPGT
jgi:hypothetical protein